MGAAEEVHVQQHGVLRLDGDAGRLLGLFQVRDGNVGLERLVGQVEADRLGEEVLQRHLIDRQRIRIGVEMPGRVDMRAGVVAQHQRHRRRRKAVAVGHAHFVVGGERRDDDLRVVRQHRHLVFDIAAEIDQDHRVSLVVHWPRSVPTVEDGAHAGQGVRTAARRDRRS
jgi:hypothetical protein